MPLMVTAAERPMVLTKHDSHERDVWEPLPGKLYTSPTQIKYLLWLLWKQSLSVKVFDSESKYFPLSSWPDHDQENICSTFLFAAMSRCDFWTNTKGLTKTISDLNVQILFFSLLVLSSLQNSFTYYMFFIIKILRSERTHSVFGNYTTLWLC